MKRACFILLLCSILFAGLTTAQPDPETIIEALTARSNGSITQDEFIRMLKESAKSTNVRREAFKRQANQCYDPSILTYCTMINYSFYNVYGSMASVAQTEATIQQMANNINPLFLASDQYCADAWKAYICSIYFPPCNSNHAKPCRSQCIDLWIKCGFGAGEIATCYSETEYTSDASCVPAIAKPELKCTVPAHNPSRLCQVTWPTPTLVESPYPRWNASDLRTQAQIETKMLLLKFTVDGITDEELEVCRKALTDYYCRVNWAECANNSPYDIKETCSPSCEDLMTICPHLSAIENPCMGTTPFCRSYHMPAYINGDPHFGTFDRLSYSYQGYGEFVWIRTTDDIPPMDVQVRFEDCGSSIAVTCPTAVAFTLGSRNLTIKTINGKLTVLDSSDGSIVNVPYETDAGSIKFKVNNDVMQIRFDIGLIVEVGGVNLLHTLAYPTDWEKFKGKLVGLGGFYDGASVNDFKARSGEILPYPTSERNISTKFGETWRVTAEETLFYYGPGESYESFNNASAWEPIIWDELNIDIPDYVFDACEGLSAGRSYFECVFDYWATNDTSFVEAAKAFQETLNTYISEQPKPGGEPGSAAALVSSMAIILLVAIIAIIL